MRRVCCSVQQSGNRTDKHNFNSSNIFVEHQGCQSKLKHFSSCKELQYTEGFDDTVMVFHANQVLVVLEKIVNI